MAKKTKVSDAQITEPVEVIDAAPDEMEEGAPPASIAAPDEMEEAEAEHGPDEEEGTPRASVAKDDAAKIDALDLALSSAGALIVPDDDPPIAITIATSTRVKDKTGWMNISTFFDAFERRFIQPVRSSVSVERYREKSKADQSSIKSGAGGFVGGELKSGRRLRENVLNRCLWNGDIDGCTPEIFERLKNGEGLGFRCFMYTTFSHTSEEPRVRIIAPLSQPVSPDEYIEMSPFICLKIERALKCKLFDEHGNSPVQLMYNAYAPKDGAYYFKDFRGDVLDVEALFKEQSEHEKEYAAELAAALHVDAADAVAKVPERSKGKTGKRPGDPRKREGIPGVFNRAYFPINKAIDKFLSHIYKAETPDRYTYIAGSAGNGLSVMDGYHVYAWDATNKAINNGHAYDAFDLVTAHLYGGSDKAARAELKNDGGVKRQIFEERRDKVREDFLDFPEDDETPDIWKESLRVDDNERYLPTPDNCALIIENDPLFKNIAFNEMAGREEITGPVPWTRGEGAGKLFDETDRAELLVLIDKVYECDFTDRALDAAIKTVTNRRRFHPFREFLEALPAWDGKKRTAEILHLAFDAPATDYVAAVMRKSLCAIIARTYHPGTKFDYVPVLDGEQGIGKTSFLIWLVGSQFYNGGITFEKMRSNAAAIDMQGFALCEFQELAGLNKAETRTARAFITETRDIYRAPYDRKAKEHPRVPIFWGTVNGYGGYLRDAEGNRRYWPIKCKRKSKSGAIWYKLFDENYRLQLWAEAAAAYKFGEALTMDNDPALAAAALAAQNGAIEIDTRAGLVERYLSIRYPAGWDAMSIDARISWLNSDFKEEAAAVTGVLKEKVCAMEIYREAWQGDPVHMSSKDRDDIRRIMAKLPEWEPITDGRPRFPGYGQSQPAWRRVTIPPEPDNGEPVPMSSGTISRGTSKATAAPDGRINFPPRDEWLNSAPHEVTPPEPSEHAARGAGSGHDVSDQPKRKEPAIVEVIPTSPAALDAWRIAARAIIAYITGEKHERSAGEIVQRYTQNGINGAEFAALQNIITDSLDFCRGIGWGFGNAGADAIRSALTNAKDPAAAGDVLKALQL